MWAAERYNREVDKETRLTNQRLLRRIVIAGDDLSRAGQFVRIILERELFRTTTEIEDRMLEGMLTALVVAYRRSFTRNFGSDYALPTLPEVSRGKFTPSEEALHERLGVLRDTAFAHSDAGAKDVKINIITVNGERFSIPSFWDYSSSLSKEDVVSIQAMIAKLRQYLVSEQIRLQRILPEGRF